MKILTMPNHPKSKFIPNPREYMEGKNSHQQFQHKLNNALLWLYHNGYASDDVICTVAGQKKRGFGKHLVRKGYCAETKTKSGSPKFFYTLSKHGHDHATALVNEPMHIEKYLTPLKLSQNNLEHDLLTQRISLRAIKKYEFRFRSKYQTSLAHLKGQKIPDALWIDRHNFKIAVEVELSQKFGRQLDETVAAIVNSIEQGIFDCYFFFVRSPAITTNYSRKMQGGTKIPIWYKDHKNMWIKSSEIQLTVPGWVKDKVFFMPAEENFIDPRPIEFGL